MGRSITNVLCFIVLISLVIPKGLSQIDPRCPPKAIRIVQNETGNKVGSKTEWKVSVTNTCGCSVYNLQLLCPNFETVVVGKNDQYIISETDKSGHCLFNNGGGFAGSTISFTYVGDRVDFALDTYYVACS